MKRLFVGIPVSADVREKLKVLLIQLLKSGANETGLKVVAPENLHFTLKFLGEVNESKTAEIIQKLSFITSSQKNFFINFDKLGAFPSLNYINILWVGGESPEMVSLMKKVNLSLNQYHPEPQYSPVPHVTLARVKSTLNQKLLRTFIEQQASRSFGHMNIGKMVLYASELRPEGPKYTLVKEFSLG